MYRRQRSAILERDDRLQRFVNRYRDHGNPDPS